MTGTRQQAIGGVRSLAMATMFAKALGFGSQLVLARLLLREHFGVFAFTISLVTLVGQLTNFEARRDILRMPENAAQRARAYVFVQAAIGVALAAAVFVGAGPLAGLGADLMSRGDAAVAVPYLQALCFVPLIEGLRQPAVGLLEARMRFRTVARLEYAAASLQAAAGVVLAVAGAGAWALVGSFYSGAIVRLAGSWAIEGGTALRVRCRREDLVSVWRFGAPVLAANLLTAWYWKGDDLMVGASLGWVAAGLYSIAFEAPRALLQVTANLGRVGLALLGQQEGRDGAKQARVFGVVARANFALLGPAVAVGLVHAELLLRVAFGAKWSEAAPAFRVFLVLVLMRGPVSHWVDVATTRGRPDLFTKSTLATAAALPLFGVFLLRYGITGMAVAVLGSWCVSAPFYLGWVRRQLDIRFSELFRPGCTALCASLLLGIGLVAALPPAESLRFMIIALQVVVFVVVLMRSDRELAVLFRQSLLRRAGA